MYDFFGIGQKKLLLHPFKVDISKVDYVFLQFFSY